MNFRNLSIITAIITFILGIGYIFFGTLVVGRWQIEITDSLLLVGRRAGSLYIGLSVIFFLSRNAPVSAARTAICTGTAIALALLAILGLYEYLSDNIASSILASIGLESLLAIGFARIVFMDRHTNRA